MAKDIHKKIHPNEIRKSYLENRTSWKWYDRVLKKHTNIEENTAFIAMSVRIQLEILKELQYMNDRQKTKP